MANDVLKTLHAMETELAAIKSAKEQVEAAVAADTAISSSLKIYSSSLSNLSAKCNEIKDSLKAVAVSVTEETDKFSASLDERVKNIENAAKRLSDMLDEFKRNLEEILGIKTIAEKTMQIESVCEVLVKKLTELDSKQNSAKKTIVQSVTKANDSILQRVDAAKNTITAAIDAKASAIGSSISSLGTNLDKSISFIESSLVSKSTALTNNVSSAERGVKVTITDTGKKLTRIGFMAIVLIIIDIILRFI